MTEPTRTPIACDMTGAPDTPQERLEEYDRLFATALIAQERSPAGVTMRLRRDEGVEVWVRDLAAREKACCPFFDFEVTTAGDEVIWHATVIDDPLAREILDEWALLPKTASSGVAALEDRFVAKGLTIKYDADRPSPSSGPPRPGAQ
jgi:hypothetical protein